MVETPRRPVSDLLREFHTRPGADYVSPSTPTVTVPGALCRAEYLIEEAAELRAAIAAGDLIGAADALADVVYTAYGAAWRFGIDLDAVVAEVHRSNLTKTPAPGDGKAIKGPGYCPPDIAAALTAAGPATPLPPGVTVQRSACVTVTCRGCATPLGEDDDDLGATLHFPDYPTAKTTAEAAGWTCTPDGARCTHCTARHRCERDGHAWSDWAPCGCRGQLREHTVQMQYRLCQRPCGSLDERPAATAEGAATVLPLRRPATAPTGGDAA